MQSDRTCIDAWIVKFLYFVQLAASLAFNEEDTVSPFCSIGDRTLNLSERLNIQKPTMLANSIAAAH